MNKVILTAILAGCLSFAAGCSTSDGSNWVKDETPRSASQQDYAECKYQAETATATIGTNSRPKTMTDAIGDGIGDGIVKGMEQADLVKDCMRARGYTQS
ncbi:hypothetical protein [Mesorhizobium sp. DCY119]|uniref:hypothetical protein n=1 Tax=Mesorhizobium sp. DCY119 TaxID=2108445 RepID=UPI001058577C|nr:hypothetical protein [Mesorhizobium sp. DCY119]